MLCNPLCGIKLYVLNIVAYIVAYEYSEPNGFGEKGRSVRRRGYQKEFPKSRIFKRDSHGQLTWFTSTYLYIQYIARKEKVTVTVQQVSSFDRRNDPELEPVPEGQANHPAPGTIP